MIFHYNYKYEKFQINCYTAPSSIHGIGVYAKEDILKNDILFEAIDENNKITYYGSLVNHCNNPTSKLIQINNKWFLVALKNLKKGDEIIADYRDTPDFIKKPDPNWKC